MKNGLFMLAGCALGLSGASVSMAQQTTDEVRAVVAEMLADAETRSSLLAGGDAGHDGTKFFIQSDGFRLNIGGMLQFRYMMNFREDDQTTTAFPDDFTHGFTLARARIDFDGELNKDWFFRARINADQSGFKSSGTGGQSSSSFSDDAGIDYFYGGYKFANGGKLTFGQFKLPFLREELVSDAKQLTVERSVVNSVFTQNYSQGVEFAYEQEQWRGFLAFSDGLNSANTDFTDRENTSGFRTVGQADYAFTGRFEFLGSGNWKQFESFTSTKGDPFGLLIGAAAHWQQSDNTGLAADVDRDTFGYTIDASLKGDSWSLYGAFIGRYQENSNGGNETDFNDFGAIVQGGWRFAQNTELFARWDALFIDDERPGFATEDTFNFLTVGLNQYYAENAAKASVDVLYSFERTDGLFATGAIPNTKVGLLGSTDDGELAIRLQFQLVF